MKLHRIVPITMLVLLCHSIALADEAGIQKWVDNINRQNAGILMIGSSMQGEGIDFRTLSEDVGIKVADLRSGGSMSPWHYNMMKFVIPRVENKPKMVIIETRQNYLMQPRKRMRWGAYSNAVNELAGEDRAVLDKLAFSDEGEGRPVWRYADDQEANSPAPPDSFYWDFNKAVEHSFLPYMIDIAKESGYQLVVVRHKARVYAEDPTWEQPQHRKYGEDMAAYLASKDIVFLDYTYNPELKLEHYKNGDHLDRTLGRPIWTRLLGEDLKAILANKPAPNQRPKKD